MNTPRGSQSRPVRAFGLALLVATVLYAGPASAVHYMRLSAGTGVATSGASCVQFTPYFVKRYTGWCAGGGYSVVRFPVPTEYRGSAQNATVWITTMDGADGAYYANVYSYYEDGTAHTGTNFNSGSSLAEATEYSAVVQVPEDGYMVITSYLQDDDGIASFAWEYDY